MTVSRADVMPRLRRAWGRFVGPEATHANQVLTVGATAMGAVAVPYSLRSQGAGAVESTVAALMAVDLIGGAYVNHTRACARWYERPGQGDLDHLLFAALHVHPGIVVWLDHRNMTRAPGWTWAASHYAYLITSTLAIRRFATHRRVLGVTLTAGGLLLDRLLGPSKSMPWFAWAYYPKLLSGHAAASLWSDQDLTPTKGSVR